MQKTNLLIMLLTIFSVSSVFAQSKAKSAKVIPSIQNVEERIGIHQTNELFQQKLETTEEDEMVLLSTKVDELGYVHQKFQQRYNSIPVEGRTVTVHSQNGFIDKLSGNFQPLDEMDTRPDLTRSVGLQYALNHVGATKYAWEGNECVHEEAFDDHGHDHSIHQPEGELVIFVHPNDKSIVRLAYKYDVYASEPLYRAYVYVDADNGDVLFENHRIHNTDANGSCSTLYNGTQSITVDYTGSNYRLRQAADGGGIQTYDLNNGTNYNNASDVTSNSSTFGSGSATANQAHYGAEQTHQYFMSNHSRNSYNGSGAIIRSYVSYSSNYVNAFWDGSRMTYGDGDGVNYGPLVSLDIVGHEITHGVTEYTADLVYSYESGALNESFSDIFGESIENYAQGTNDWLMGDHIGAGGSGGALRNMANPGAFGDPDTYLGSGWNGGSSDNGGVHTNSGVQNYWFYLLCQGGTGTNDNGYAYDVPAIGMAKAAAIAYRNLSVYLTTSSNYAAARTGAIAAANDLYGATEAAAVAEAWCAVGVGACSGPPAPCVASNTVTVTITFDNYPEETSWSITSGGSTIASNSYSSANPDGSTVTETVNVPVGDYTFTINDSYGDGICCSYGSGSYSVDAGGTNIASGGSFSSSESTSFCTESGVDPCAALGGDTDGDGVCDDNDNCPSTSNSNQADVDNDGIGDVCDSCTDVDNDGVCADVDCDDNDGSAGAQQAPGTACNDGDPNTDNDVILADGCGCAGTAPPGPCDSNGGDADGDGVCADVDCDDNDSNVGAQQAQGTACDDGNANTENDEIQADGCSCAGTPTGGGTTTVFAHYFESGWDGWSDGGSDCYRYNGSRSWEGNRSIRIRDNSGTASAMTSGVYDLSGYTSVDLEFYFYSHSMENGEDFWVRYYNGSSWTTVATYARGTSFENGNFYTATVTIASNLVSNAQFRFQCDASGNADHIYIDEVTLTGTSGAGFIERVAGQTIKEIEKPVYSFGDFDDEELEGFTADKLKLYPNPATSELNINLVEGSKMIRVYSLTGSLIMEQKVTDMQENIDISTLKAGTYFIAVELEGKIMHQRFVKL